MFSGIIEEMGVVKEFVRGHRSAQVSIIAKQILSNLAVGDSVSVNGVCLTVFSKSDEDFKVDISFETMDVTDLGSLNTGDAVNLERALQIGSRLSGHWVSGHIDGIGYIRNRQKEDESLLLAIEAPPHVLRYCIAKGSIAVDGISLTINDIGKKQFQVAVIPHTAKATTLGLKGVDVSVNLEADMIGKFVERLLAEKPPQARISREFLKGKGLG